MPNNSNRVLTYLAAHPEGQNDDQIGEALLQKFLAEEARKFERVFAVEAKFHRSVKRRGAAGRNPRSRGTT